MEKTLNLFSSDGSQLLELSPPCKETLHLGALHSPMFEGRKEVVVFSWDGHREGPTVSVNSSSLVQPKVLRDEKVLKLPVMLRGNDKLSFGQNECIIHVFEGDGPFYIPCRVSMGSEACTKLKTATGKATSIALYNGDEVLVGDITPGSTQCMVKVTQAKHHVGEVGFLEPRYLKNRITKSSMQKAPQHGVPIHIPASTPPSRAVTRRPSPPKKAKQEDTLLSELRKISGLDDGILQCIISGCDRDAAKAKQAVLDMMKGNEGSEGNEVGKAQPQAPSKSGKKRERSTEGDVPSQPASPLVLQRQGAVRRTTPQALEHAVLTAVANAVQSGVGPEKHAVLLQYVYMLHVLEGFAKVASPQAKEAVLATADTGLAVDSVSPSGAVQCCTIAGEKYGITREGLNVACHVLKGGETFFHDNTILDRALLDHLAGKLQLSLHEAILLLGTFAFADPRGDWITMLKKWLNDNRGKWK
eukprot:Sspe_Gene.64765::Locus_38368_Transcript_1_7_Confidence_0.300_Length_2150::g.64765::m.64765